MATNKITNTVEAITIEDTQNAYAWGKKNLSAARYRAFDRQMCELGRNKTSAEYRAAWKATQEIEDAHLRASAQRIEDIKTKAQVEADMIQKQIDELSARKREIADAMLNEVTRIRCEVYSSPAYMMADAKRIEEGQKDLAIFLPKVQKLMQKFLNLQLQADTDAAVEEMSRA